MNQPKDMKSIFFCKVFFVILGIMLVSGCDDEDGNAKDSLIGEWDVSKTALVTGDLRSESVDSGFMNFGSQVVEYDFKIDSTHYEGTSNWTLNTEMVNEGFIKVPKYTLSITSLLEFDVRFGDMTDGAEKNATFITMTEITENQEESYLYLELNKK